MSQDLPYPSELVLPYSIQDAFGLLDSLPDFIFCYSVNTADLFSPTLNQDFKC